MAEITGPTPLPIENVDVRDAEQVTEYFAALERDYPQIVEAIRVMGISYDQYLIALQSMTQQSSFSSSTTRIYG
jgi:hypothetical protein